MLASHSTMWLLLAFAFVSAGTVFAAGPTTRPVNPNATPEAVQLYQYLYSISGHKTLAGQHCNPLVGSTRLIVVDRTTGHYPALFGQDFGFDEPGSWDGINFRQRIVDDAITRNQEGFIIALMWHAVRPIEDEPVSFQHGPQGKLTDAQWHDLITPGTEINERWKSQVDVIAWHLRQLQFAGVPVIWRPYHEVNGNWFWWGNRPGENGSKKLYRMLYDRLVNFHKLNNLIWVYSCNELGGENAGSYADCYPGDDEVDVLATDVYRRGFAQQDYDQLLALGGDRPIALAEVGSPPSPAILKKQPRWTWFMSWGDPTPFRPPTTGPTSGPAPATLREVYTSDQVITYDKLPWVHLTTRPTVHYPILK